MRKQALSRIRSGRICGAWSRKAGRPCIAKPMKNGRCRFHGGMSTGPRTPEGRARALLNLKVGRPERQSEGRMRSPADSGACAPQCASSVRDRKERTDEHCSTDQRAVGAQDRRETRRAAGGESEEVCRDSGQARPRHLGSAFGPRLPCAVGSEKQQRKERALTFANPVGTGGRRRGNRPRVAVM